MKFFIILTALDLCCYMQAFSSGREQELLSGCGVWASCAGGFSCCRVWAPDAGSVLVAHRLGCLSACGIFQDWGSNPHTLHSQVDS